MTVAGPFWIAAALLVLAGAQKVVSPRSTVDALRALGLSFPPVLVRFGAGAEAVVGAVALTTGWRALAGVVGLLYLSFVAFLSVRLRRDGDAAAPCGCLGAHDAPPTPTHLVITVAGATCALLATLWPVPGLLHALRDEPMGTVTMAALVILGCWFSMLAFTALPRLAALRHGTAT